MAKKSTVLRKLKKREYKTYLVMGDTKVMEEQRCSFCLFVCVCPHLLPLLFH